MGQRNMRKIFEDMSYAWSTATSHSEFQKRYLRIFGATEFQDGIYAPSNPGEPVFVDPFRVDRFQYGVFIPRRRAIPESLTVHLKM